ncbi:hypothetical protein RhiirC2_771125 [Rhizophagus irregularis]|uniref:Uncharacterized protein n=1 Tax=Rhizophagus irregularis TaxID=588596 RepID=A0A2N1NUM2_9GLOM|nr:hypothetical protein RhiirC2_771125 [Rhizophagus irregularis]
MVKLYKLYAPDRDEYHEKVSRAYSLLGIQHDDETPKMWCSRIRSPFRKMFEEYPDIFSKNELFIPENTVENHLKRALLEIPFQINVQKEKSIALREFHIWQYKQYILRELEKASIEIIINSGKK